MTIALVLNIVLATVVVVGIVGMLAWSIATQDVDAPNGLVRNARRRRASARSRFVGRTVEKAAGRGWCCWGAGVGGGPRSLGGSSTDRRYAFPGWSEADSRLANQRSEIRAPPWPTEVSAAVAHRGQRRRGPPRSATPR